MLKEYRIMYQWQDRHYTTIMKHYFAAAAVQAAQIAIMNGAKVYGVEPA